MRLLLRPSTRAYRGLLDFAFGSPCLVERGVHDAHDGTWVAHPDLMPVAKEMCDRMPQPNQLGRPREDVKVSRDDLLVLDEGTKIEDGFRLNIRVGRAIHRGLAARPRRGADLQSDGRRGDFRNLARANLAMAEIQGVLDMASRSRRLSSSVRSTSKWTGSSARSGPPPVRAAASRKRSACSAPSRWRRTSASFPTLPAYTLID
jgi:Malate synthase